MFTATPKSMLFLSTAPQINVTIIPARHSRMLLAGIQKEGLDARLRGHDGCKLDTQLSLLR